jgi:hypothetical protein
MLLVYFATNSPGTVMILKLIELWDNEHTGNEPVAHDAHQWPAQLTFLICGRCRHLLPSKCSSAFTKVRDRLQINTKR